MAANGKAQSAHDEYVGRLRAYGLVAAIIIVLAIVSFAVAPSGSGIAGCRSILFGTSQPCVESLAIETLNSTMCAGLHPAYANQCYLAIAQNTSDQELCRRINGSVAAGQCYLYIANSTKDPALCSMVNGSAGSECAYSIAVETNDTSACPGGSGTGAGKECASTIYMNDAVKTGNAALCSEITSSNESNDTYGIIINSSLGKYPGLALNITQILEYGAITNATVGAMGICYTSVAMRTGNESYCNYVQGSALGNACTEYFIRSNQSKSGSFNATALMGYCNQAGANSTTCKYGLETVEAYDSGNLTICKGIPAPYSYNCYYYLAEKYNDSSYCNYIANSTINGACVGDVSGLYNNATGG